MYTLRLSDDHTKSAAVSIVVLPAVVEGELPLWTQLAAMDLGAVEAVELELPLASSKKGWRSPRLSEAYLAAIEVFAEGRTEAAVGAVMELEVEGLGRGLQKNYRRVLDSELAVIRQLSNANPHTLVPLTLLHDALYRQYRGGRHRQLATHSLKLALALGQEHADLVPRGSGAGFFDDYLLDRAGKMLQSGSYPDAHAFLQRILDRDRDRPEILLALAVIHEALGQYREAVDLLREAYRIDRKPGEVRLRLAINMIRIGQRGNIVSLLEGCLEPEAPDWVRTVAYQELARYYRSQGQSKKAVALLERATAEPDAQQRLFLQLAALLDNAGQPEAAREVVEKLRSSPGQDVDSPRLQYSDWPLWVFEPATTEMARRGTEAMPELKAALGVLPAHGGQ